MGPALFCRWNAVSIFNIMIGAQPWLYHGPLGILTTPFPLKRLRLPLTLPALLSSFRLIFCPQLLFLRSSIFSKGPDIYTSTLTNLLSSAARYGFESGARHMASHSIHVNRDILTPLVLKSGFVKPLWQPETCFLRKFYRQYALFCTAAITTRLYQILVKAIRRKSVWKLLVRVFSVVYDIRKLF